MIRPVLTFRRRTVRFCLFLCFLAFAQLWGAREARASFYAACAAIATVPCPVIDKAQITLNIAEMAMVSTGFAMQFGVLAEIIATLGAINVILNKYLSMEPVEEPNWTLAAVKDGAAAAATKKVLSNIITKATDATSDMTVENVILEKQTNILAETNPPLASEQYLCSKMVACQGPQVMQKYASGIAKVIADGISALYRTSDGSGPYYSGKDKAFRCGDNAGGLKFGRPSDGYEEECQALSSTSLTSLADADISVRTLYYDSPLQVPHLTEKTYESSLGNTVKFNLPDLEEGSTSLSDLAEKKAWIGAVGYCIKMAGPRPQPPTGSMMDTPEGRRKRAKWNSCLSIQNEFVRRCADRVGMLSRPDCANEENKDICEAALHACNSARQTHMTLPASLRNCAAGMNLYEAITLCGEMCASNREAQAKVLTGASQARMMADTVLCELSQSVRKKYLENENAAYNNAVVGLGRLAQCWAEVDDAKEDLFEE